MTNIDRNEDQQEEQQRITINGEVQKDLLTRQISNSVNYDNAILTLSSGALGLSLAFIKNIVPIEKTLYSHCLIVSWVLFCLAIISTLLSFLVSQKGLETQRLHAYEYYIKKNDEYLDKENIWRTLTDYLNLFSGLFFISAVIITIYFVAINIGESRMKNADRVEKNLSNLKVESTEPIIKGQNIPALQPILKKKDLTNNERTKEAEPNQSNQKK